MVCYIFSCAWWVAWLVGCEWLLDVMMSQFVQYWHGSAVCSRQSQLMSVVLVVSCKLWCFSLVFRQHTALFLNVQLWFRKCSCRYHILKHHLLNNFVLFSVRSRFWKRYPAMSQISGSSKRWSCNPGTWCKYETSCLHFLFFCVWVFVFLNFFFFCLPASFILKSSHFMIPEASFNAVYP